MRSLIQELKENNQDFEFYPTTDKIIKQVSKDLFKLMSDYKGTKSFSMLDIGAGNGNVFSVLENLIPDKENNLYIITKYAIEKSRILIDSMPNDIYIIGTDFYQQTLIDKKVDVIFCNPPYKEYVQWTTKILKEANCTYIYLIIPSRWKENPALIDLIKQRNKTGEVTTLGSFDFINSDYRQARSIVDIIRITIGERDYGKDTKPFIDPFDIWFNDFFKINAEKNNDGKYEKEKNKKVHIQELVKGHNLIERLEELYNKDMEDLILNYKTVEKLNQQILKELDINIDGLKAGIRMKIEGLKNIYWNELFNNLDKITERLTFQSRKKILESLTSQTNIDFTSSNVYAVVIWVIKNANKYIDKQLLELYLNMTDKENIINFKSNTRMIQDGWRFQAREHTHYILDYRIICHKYNCFPISQYGHYNYPNGLNKDIHNFLEDICTVAKNLGFNVCSRSTNFQWKPGEPNDFYMIQTEKEVVLFMSVRAHKKGTVHIKINQEFMKAFNIEAARLNKWIKSPEEFSLETEINKDESIMYFNKNFKIQPSHIKLLEKKDI